MYRDKIDKDKMIKRGWLLFAFVLALTAMPEPAVARTTTAVEQEQDSYEKLGKNNETLPQDFSDDDLYGLPELADGEQKDYHTLQLQVTKTDLHEIRLSWNVVKDADGYELYGARCNAKGKRYRVTQITDLGAPTLTAWMCTGLKKNTYYKFAVRAYQIKNGRKTYLVRSRAAHAPTSGGTYGYIRQVDVKTPDVTMTAGGSYTIRPVVDRSGLRQNFHNTLRYESSDISVATVDENGRIKAVGKGRAVVYVYATNGCYAVVLVVVR